MSSSAQPSRYGLSRPVSDVSVAQDWRLERVTAPSRLFGANGLRTGPDGRVYIAQVTGSQISALDPRTGQLEVFSAKGGEIVAPDDVAFDASGNLFATEVMDGRVSMRDTAGRTRVLRDDVPVGQRHYRAPRPTVPRRVPRGRAPAGVRSGRRPAAGVARDSVPSPNAMEVGPGRPAVFPGNGRQRDLARSIPTAANTQRVAGDLGVPDSVKFDAAGYIVSTQVAQRVQVLRIDPRSGEQRLLAQLSPGPRQLHLRRRPGAGIPTSPARSPEIAPDGETRDRAARRAELAAGSDRGHDGRLYIADGTYFYDGPAGRSCRPSGCCSRPAIPGFCAASCRVDPVSSW